MTCIAPADSAESRRNTPNQRWSSMSTCLRGPGRRAWLTSTPGTVISWRPRGGVSHWVDRAKSVNDLDPWIIELGGYPALFAVITTARLILH
uniref:Uncharacterized protein n=1 Tax=Bionectria ochroleuca TaxID=29856 RepID=A0A0B7KBN0_BIOOC